MVRKFLVATLLVAHAGALIAQDRADAGTSPDVLRFWNSDGTPNRPTGLLYQPEVLAALVAERAGEPTSDRIIQAIKQQTAIVVMWRIPDGFPDSDKRGPSRTILWDSASGKNAIEPIWQATDASDLRAIDPHTSFQDIERVAAFPAAEFQPGRYVLLFAPLPDDPITGAHRSVRVIGDFRDSKSRRR